VVLLREGSLLHELRLDSPLAHTIGASWVTRTLSGSELSRWSLELQGMDAPGLVEILVGRKAWTFVTAQRRVIEALGIPPEIREATVRYLLDSQRRLDALLESYVTGRLSQEEYDFLRGEEANMLNETLKRRLGSGYDWSEGWRAQYETFEPCQ
jgi:hypothetical protein